MSKSSGRFDTIWYETAMRGSPQKALECGLYHSVLEQLGGSASLGAEEAVALIGSYAFLGRLDEAFELWKLKEPTLSLARKTRCRFFLGVAATRTYRFEEGRAFFDANLKSAKKSPYAAQGMGFYFYFTGQFAHAKTWAAAASSAAVAAKDGYIRFLATDLLGHSTVQLGRRSEGLRLIRLAGELALKHGNLNFASAFNTATLIYEAEAGWRPETIAGELELMLGELAVVDSYTRGNLVLELARQWTLHGNWRQARELLNRESSSIYAFGNRRQELVLQLRLAELAYRQGDRFAAEHFVRAGRRCLQGIADRAFEIRVLGLESKLAETYSGAVPEALSRNLTALSEEHSSLIHQQMLYRKGLANDPGTSEAEDPLHQLLLQAQADPRAAAEKSLERGFVGLWPQFRGVAPGQSVFAVLEDGQSFVMVAPDGIVYRPKSLSSQNHRLLRALSGHVIDKENLVKQVWGYRYSPLQHDPLLYSAMTKLRKALAPYDSWIVTTEDGWRLASHVEWQLRDRAGAVERAEQAVQVAPSEGGSRLEQQLNFRQLRLLEASRRAEPWSIQAYKKQFAVSTMTAYRDLDGLRDLRLLVRSGKGRATRYHMKPQAGIGSQP